MLSDWPSGELVLACLKCGKRERHAVATLLLDGDRRQTDLIAHLTSDCPKRQAASFYDWCAAMLTRDEAPDLSGTSEHP